MAASRHEIFGSTDVGALSAGAIAVIISMSDDPDPYDLIDFATGLTLVAIIVAYVWSNPRSRRMSMAVAAAVGLAFVPLVGFVVELALAPEGLGSGLLAGVAGDRSRVASGVSFLGWLLVALVAYAVDRRRQQALADRAVEEPSGASIQSGT